MSRWAKNGKLRAGRWRRAANGYPPLSEMAADQRREFHEALLDAGSFEDLPGSGKRRSSPRSRTGRSCGLSASIEWPKIRLVSPFRRA